MTQTIRVVLADDHGVVRRGIRDFLAEAGDITVVAEAGDGAQAYDLVVKHQPDVVLLDVQMPNGTGIDVARRLREARMAVGVLMLTAFDDPPYIKASLEAGANGYVLKSSEAEDIIEAVRAVYEGKTVFSAGLTLPPSPASTAGAALTDRERDVLQLVARGLTNKAIGFQLSISDRTVQGHLANIYDKLGAASRTEAVTRAVSLGLINVPRA
ncbi:MAG: response regulator transcription factor [Anaerolineae bacterium]|nr:response regulator transcription factor [Anaerolineae bacterium]